MRINHISLYGSPVGAIPGVGVTCGRLKGVPLRTWRSPIRHREVSTGHCHDQGEYGTPLHAAFKLNMLQFQVIDPDFSPS